MKKLIIFIAVLFVSANILSAQSRISFGANWGVLWPKGYIADNQDYGFSAGLMVDIPIKSKPYSLVTGLSWNFLECKEFITYDEWGNEEDYYYTDTWDMISVSFGPKFSTKFGLYFLPAFAFNDAKGDKRIGLEVGAGVLLPVKLLKFKFDINTKYRLANLLLKENKEKSVQLLSLTLGIII